MTHSMVVIDRMKEACGAATDHDLASFLGVPRATVASWKRRGSIPQDYVLAFAAKCGVSLDWIIRGEGNAKKGFVLPDIDHAILAVAIERAFAVKESSEEYKDASLAQLASLVVQYYTDLYSIIGNVITADEDGRDQVLRTLRRVLGLSEDIDSETPQQKVALEEARRRLWSAARGIVD